jgi:glycosyltransferase involved in cell wall biosynthesis
VQVLTHPTNRGYGSALKTGIRHARFELVAITDADGTYPADRLLELADAMTEADSMVVGARTGTSVEIPLVRRPAKWLLTTLANYLAGERIPDLNSGLRVMRRQVVQRYQHILPAGYSFTTTITLALLTSHHLVRYIPIDYAHRVGRSKFHPVRDTWNMGILILRTVMYFKPLKFFVPLAALVALAGIGVFTWSYVTTQRAMDTTLAVSLMTAVQLVAIGLLADLIDKRTLQ